MYYHLLVIIFGAHGENRMIQLKDNNWFKMYRELFEIFDDNFELACFASYIISIYAILQDVKFINGIEYRRVSDSYINMKFIMNSPKIRRYLNEMQNKGLIDIEHATNSKRSFRYIRLLVEIIE